MRGLFSAHYCNFRDRWSRMRAQNECRSRDSRLFARDARVGKRNCDRRVAAPAGERKTRIAFTPDNLTRRRIEERSDKLQQRLLLRSVSTREEVRQLDAGDLPS